MYERSKGVLLVIKTLKIGAINYRVEEVIKLNGINAEGTGMAWLNGRVQCQDALIELEAGLPNDVKRVALLHEAMHAILEQAGIEHSEQVIIALSYGTLALLNDNALLPPYLMKDE